MYVHVYVYVYIYIYVGVYIYIYIYIDGKQPSHISTKANGMIPALQMRTRQSIMITTINMNNINTMQVRTDCEITY